MARDVVVIGGGAAGLATAIFAARAGLGDRVVALDGARRLGAKILISGGGRCNVTNAVVTERDFWGGNRHLIRRVLTSFPVAATIDFFREIGVTLHEEENGKLFPDSNRAATVLQALVDEAERRGVRLETAARVTGLVQTDGGFVVETAKGPVEAGQVVLATGGLSIPKTGSDGVGYGFARTLGHAIVPPTPALAPLVLDGDAHRRLQGVTHVVELTIEAAGAERVRVKGSMLWTHFGISGPVVLNASRLWHRADLEGRPVTVTANLVDGRGFEEIEPLLLQGPRRPSVRAALQRLMPAAVADAVFDTVMLDGATSLGALTREDRRRLVHAVTAWRLPVTGSRGYGFAEATAGGIELTEIDVGRMESRRVPGLFLAGEVLDVDGRIGGFNFQWAWSTGYVVGRALARS